MSALGGWTDGNTARGFVNTNTGDQYKVKIKGNTSVPYNNGPKTGEDAAYAPTGSNYSRSVYDAGKDKDATGTDVTYSNDVSLSNVSVNGETKDYSKFLTENVQGVSNKLLKVKATGTVAAGTAPAGSYSRYHYRYMDPTETGINKNSKYDFNFVEGTPGANQQKEKLITFTGKNDPSLEVFDVDASMLNSDGYSGISFAFMNISDTASVVINVTGSNAVTFNNGWRFWWDGEEISNGYVTANAGDGHVTDTMRKAYSNAAQKIMWNFAKTSKLTINGGKALNGSYRQYGHSSDGKYTLTSQDDPAAAMLGSIMVPNGSFESHVTTNGRVYVGGDFSMYNPNNIGVNMAEGETASVIDMDQERHNLPWNGSYSTSCAAIAWNKVDDTAGHNALGGTSWTVYGKKEDAVNGTNALATIADGGWNDDADAEGSFQLGNLAKNGTYFLKESGTAEGYAQNTNIYQINTGGTTDAAKNIVHVFNSTGIEITAEADKLLTDGKIINKRTGSAIEWQKVDGTDNSTLLAGSTWTLSKMNGNTAEQSWAITDDQSGTEVKSITITDANSNVVASDTTITFKSNNSQTFTATAYDQQNQVITGAKLTWSSNNATVASVDQNGTVTPTGDGNTTITVKSADGKVTASFTVEVSGVTVETSVSISGYTNGQEISLEKGKTLKLTASVAPQSNTVEWSTSNNADNVSLSTTTGTSVTLTANKVTSSPVTITAKEIRGNKTFTLSVTVTAKQYLTLYFQAQNDWPANNVKVHYQTTNDTVWTDISMTQMDGSCNSYAYANIPLTGSNAIDSTSQFGFQHINGSGWYGPGSASVPKANDKNFKFTNDNTLPEVVVISAGPSYSITAPSGCAVTSTAAYSSRRVAARSGEHRAVASVLRTQSSVVNVLENSTVSSKKDEDTKAGKFKVSDLADGKYRLQEKTAPNGYEVSDTVYTITITGGNATWSPGITDSKIENTRKTGTVKWSKVSSEHNTEFLSGAEWKLTRIKTFSWNNGVATYVGASDDLGTVKDCVDGEGGVSDCSTQSGQYVDLNGDKGKFELHGLEWGEYQLVETKAPDGFNLDSTPHTFRFGPVEGSDVSGKWYTNSQFEETTADYEESAAFTVDGGSITNIPGVVLPGTGGEGLNKMYAAGFLAVAIAVAGLALSLRRRQ